MESIKESIYKTKSALADWNIISKNDNKIKIEIDDSTSNNTSEILSKSVSEKSTNLDNTNKVNKLDISIQTETKDNNISNNISNNINENKISETSDIIKKCQMIDDMFLKIEKMESKIYNLEKKIKDNENQTQKIINFSKDSIDSLNESNDDLNRTMIQHTTPIGLKYLSYTHSIYPNYNNNLLFNHYTFSPSTMDILQNLPDRSSAITQHPEVDINKTKKDKNWSFLGMKIL